MTYRIEGLAAAQFLHLFDLDDAALAARGIDRGVVTETPGTPCRVSLEDAEPGDEVLLLPYVHHEASSPYRASGPIFVGRRAVERGGEVVAHVDEVPLQLRRRLVSVRAYDASARMIEADVCDGTGLHARIGRFFTNPSAAYLHVHFAQQGCYAAKVLRA